VLAIALPDARVPSENPVGALTGRTVVLFRRQPAARANRIALLRARAGEDVVTVAAIGRRA
jgi:hypothetical protein